ncbi:cold-shock protein [Pseudomonas sp. H9]|uniref:cold-shock protein n=1 Tax=Pseudomonas sp. H9 TaxID=483968 RepID=UPI001057CB49|nr:cold shock domain-containing protein [Pseudomonas sp. H9]TDF85888.1 cold-shock protein [Pseudomonas sp. H9]
MPTGTVKHFDSEKGIGVIIEEGEPSVDIFVHFSAINSGGFRALEEGQRVEFDITQSSAGPQAVNVQVL